MGFSPRTNRSRDVVLKIIATITMKVGAIAGLISVVPLLAVLVLAGNLFLFVVAAGGAGVPSVVGGLGVAILVVAFFGLLLYVAVLSAIGGWLGSYAKSERII